MRRMSAFGSTLLDVEEFPAARRAIRVAVVTETYPPEINGVATTIARVVLGLQARGHDVQLVRPRQGQEDAAATGERFHEVLMRGLPIPRYANLRMGVPSKRSLVQLWSVHRPDVVHVATEGPLGWSALQAARVLRLPVTSDFRTNFHAYTRHYGVGWLRKPIMAWLRRFHNACARTMVPTQELMDDLGRCGFRGLQVVSRGVDSDLFNPVRRDDDLRARWGVESENDLVLLLVGRLAPEKNLDLLVQAWSACSASSLIRPRLVVVGDGPLREQLQVRLPAAVFCGQKLGEDLARHYASADLFVFPSLTETFGNVTTEALASGLPVVAFDYAAAARRVRHGQSGWLVPFGDEAAFVQAVVAACRDPHRLRVMRQAARESMKDLGWDGVLVQFEAQLLAAIEESRQRWRLEARPA